MNELVTVALVALATATSFGANADPLVDFSGASIRALQNNAIAVEGVSVGGQYVTTVVTFDVATGMLNVRTGGVTYSFYLGFVPAPNSISVNFTRSAVSMGDASSFIAQGVLVNGDQVDMTFMFDSTGSVPAFRIRLSGGSTIELPFINAVAGQQTGCSGDRDCDGISDGSDAFPDDPNESKAFTPSGGAMMGFNAARKTGRVPGDAGIYQAAAGTWKGTTTFYATYQNSNSALDTSYPVVTLVIDGSGHISGNATNGCAISGSLDSLYGNNSAYGAQMPTFYSSDNITLSGCAVSYYNNVYHMTFSLLPGSLDIMALKVVNPFSASVMGIGINGTLTH